MKPAPPAFLLSFDFDGTLLEPQSNPAFHPHLLEALRQAKAQGGLWAINTGRSLASAVNALGEVGLFLLPDFVIANECELYCQGGTQGWTDFGKWNRTVRKADRKFTKQIRPLALHLEEWIHANPGAAECRWGTQGQFGIIAGTKEVMDQIADYILQHRGTYPDLGFQRNGNYLRLCHAAYTKGTTLLELERLVGLPPEKVFAAGDNYNDLSMLDPRVAGMRACPANAVDEVKQVVSSTGGFVASGVASEGMLEALGHYFGIRIGETGA